MALMTSYTLPIYEAVVCNLSLEKIRQEETEQEHAAMLARTLECVTASRRVVKLLKDEDFSSASAEGIAQANVALGVLLFFGRQTVSNVRKTLPSICEKYRTALATAIDEMAAINDQIEQICEAWNIASDDSLVAEIKQSLSAIKDTDKAELPPWRKALAAFSD
jgi:hypothetical protein